MDRAHTRGNPGKCRTGDREYWGCGHEDSVVRWERECYAASSQGHEGGAARVSAIRAPRASLCAAAPASLPPPLLGACAAGGRGESRPMGWSAPPARPPPSTPHYPCSTPHYLGRKGELPRLTSPCVLEEKASVASIYHTHERWERPAPAPCRPPQACARQNTHGAANAFCTRRRVFAEQRRGARAPCSP